MKQTKRLLAVLLCVCMLLPTPALALDKDAHELLADGRAYQKNKQYSRAIACFALAAQLEPYTSLFPGSIASVYWEMGDMENALIYIDKALELAPTSAENWLYRARIHLALNDLQTAANDLIYAEVCGWTDASTLKALYAEVGERAAEKANYALAAACFDQSSLALLSDEQKRAYCIALQRTGRSQAVVDLGLTLSLSDPAFDAAFAAGTLTLTESTWTDLLSEVSIVASPVHIIRDDIRYGIEECANISVDGRTFFSNSAPELGKALAHNVDDITLLSVSPDGETYLLLFTFNEITALYALRPNATHAVAPLLHANGEPDSPAALANLPRGQATTLTGTSVTLITPVDDLGVAETALDFWSSALSKESILSSCGYRWSPDGRYVTLVGDRLSAKHSVTLLDTWTGDAFPIIAHTIELNAYFHHPAFDQSGRYLYFVQETVSSDTNNTSAHALMRYDLDTQRVETCASLDGYESYYPITEMRPGVWGHLVNSPAYDQPDSIRLIQSTQTGFVQSTVSFSLPNDIWSASRMRVSLNREYALFRGSFLGISLGQLVVTTTDRFFGIDRPCYIPGLDADSLQPIPEALLVNSAEEAEAVLTQQAHETFGLNPETITEEDLLAKISALSEEELNAPDMDIWRFWLHGIAIDVNAIALSPDERYAALLCQDRSADHYKDYVNALLILDMETGALRRLDLPNLGEFPSLDFDHALQWFANGDIQLAVNNMGVRTRFTWRLQTD